MNVLSRAGTTSIPGTILQLSVEVPIWQFPCCSCSDQHSDSARIGAMTSQGMRFLMIFEGEKGTRPPICLAGFQETDLKILGWCRQVRARSLASQWQC